MRFKYIFLMLMFVFLANISYSQTVTISNNWSLLDNSVETLYRNNQSIYMRIFASSTSDLPTGDVGIIIQPYENFSIPADANYYFAKTYSGTGELATVSDFFKNTISGSVTAVIDPAYSDDLNVVRPAKIDSARSVFINIASDSIGLKTSVDQISTNTKNSTEIKLRNVMLVANTPLEITSELVASNREGIEIMPFNTEIDFWLDFDQDPVIGTSGTRRFGGVYLKLPKAINPHLISSQSVMLSIIEGGF